MPTKTNTTASITTAMSVSMATVYRLLDPAFDLAMQHKNANGEGDDANSRQDKGHGRGCAARGKESPG